MHFTGKFSARFQGKYLVVLKRTSVQGEQSRLGVVVGKHVAPRAVTRTMMKRAIREAFRLLRAQLVPGDFVVRARRKAIGSELAALGEELAALLREPN